jgi:hypothetical protein
MPRVAKHRADVANYFEELVEQNQQDALFAFSLLRFIACTYIKHLFAHHQEALHLQQLVYFVCVTSAGRLTTYIYIYISYRTANLQTLHFKYLFNKYPY